MKINEAVSSLKSYDGPFKLRLHAGAEDAHIKDMEEAYAVELPEDFKYFYRFSDGFEADRDIFNMIPLAEIIDNYEEGTHISIAEYMIYSDMWYLEVSKDDPHQYQIYVLDYDLEKIILTNSLAEFIGRFLRGGVFEIGGLYAWKDEIRSKIHGRTDPAQLKQLFGAWRECLTLDLVKVEEVKRETDWIIATEYDPHSFFIDISLSRNLNELLILLDSINAPHDILEIRLVLATVCTALLIEKIVSDRAIIILECLRWKEQFTDYERNEIGYILALWEDIQEVTNLKLQERAEKRLKDFLNNFSRLSLYNYRLWPSINANITEVFKDKL